MRRGWGVLVVLGVVACEDLSGLATSDGDPARLPDRRSGGDATEPPPADGGSADATVTLSVALDGECVPATCPTEAPWVVGCIMQVPDGGAGDVCIFGDDHTLGFLEGQSCFSGDVHATVRCSNVRPAAPPDGCTGLEVDRQETLERCQIESL